MSHPDDSEGGLSAEQVKAIFDERAALLDLVEAVADEAHPERIEALVERYEEVARVRSELGLNDHQLESSGPISIQVAGDGTVKALLIPADPSRPAEVIEVSGRDDLRQHVGGLPEATRYDYDSIIYVSDTGRIDGQPMNIRATDYIRGESEAARQGKMIGIDPSYGLYGTAVVVGADEQGLSDVPDRLIGRFVSPVREQETTTVRIDDLRDVINVASDIEDVTPEEQTALDRIRESIREAIQDRNEDGMIRIPWRRDSESGGRMWHLPLGINARLQIATTPGERPTFYVYDRRQDTLLREADEYETSLRDQGIQDLEEYHLALLMAMSPDQRQTPRGFEHPEPTDYDLGHRAGYQAGQSERRSLDACSEMTRSDHVAGQNWLDTFQEETQEREHRDQDQDRGY